MKLRLENLSNDLKSQIKPVYHVSGDEPLLVQEAMDTIRAAALKAGFTERKIFHVDRYFDWSNLRDEANTLSLFSEKKIIELRMGNAKPGTPGSKAITEYLANPNEDNVLLIEASKLDSGMLKSKWLTTIDRIGCILQLWPITFREMPSWIGNRARQMQLTLNQDALSMLTERLEGNLLAAVQELEKLKLNYPDQAIGAQEVIDSVGDSSRFDIFKLTDACIEGNSQRATQILNHLRAESFEPNFALWALGKDIRILEALRQQQLNGSPTAPVFKKHRVISKRQAPLVAASNRLNAKISRQLIALCADCDEQIKGMQKGMQPWDTLFDISLLLCGKQVIQPANPLPAT